MSVIDDPKTWMLGGKPKLVEPSPKIVDNDLFRQICKDRAIKLIDEFFDTNPQFYIGDSINLTVTAEE